MTIIIEVLRLKRSQRHGLRAREIGCYTFLAMVSNCVLFHQNITIKLHTFINDSFNNFGRRSGPTWLISMVFFYLFTFFNREFLLSIIITFYTKHN